MKKKHRLDLLKFVALAGNDQRQLAYITTLRLREGNYDLGPIITSLRLRTDDIPRFLQVVVDVWREKPSKFDLTVTGEKIVKAWVAVHGVGAVKFLRTLSKMKTEYAISEGHTPPKDPAKISSWLADLEGRKKIPDDWTFRKTLNHLHLPYAKDKRSALQNNSQPT
jgi:hypothetical protein